MIVPSYAGSRASKSVDLQHFALVKPRFGNLFRRHLASILGLVLSGLCASCGPGSISAKDAILAARAFVDALALLEKASQVYQARVAKAVQTTKEEFKDARSGASKSVDLPQIAINWEEKWKTVDAQTLALEKQFGEIETASKKYWDILTGVTREIEDRKIRDTEEKKQGGEGKMGSSL